MAAHLALPRRVRQARLSRNVTPRRHDHAPAARPSRCGGGGRAAGSGTLLAPFRDRLADNPSRMIGRTLQHVDLEDAAEQLRPDEVTPRARSRDVRCRPTRRDLVRNGARPRNDLRPPARAGRASLTHPHPRRLSTNNSARARRGRSSCRRPARPPPPPAGTPLFEVRPRNVTDEILGIATPAAAPTRQVSRTGASAIAQAASPPRCWPARSLAY